MTRATVLLVVAVVAALAALAWAGPAHGQGYPAPGATVAYGTVPSYTAPGAMPTPYGAVATPYGAPAYGPTPYGGTTGGPVTSPYGDAFGTAPTSPVGGYGEAQTGVTGAGGAPVVSLPVTPLQLSDGPGTLDVLVEGAPAFRGFEIVVTYDPQAIVLTGVSPGQLVTGAGGTLQPQGPDLTVPGTLRYGVALADITTWPQGAGVLAQLTFAPLAASSGVSVRVSEATFIEPTGQRVTATTRDGLVVVPAPPAPAVQTQSVAAATALALATPSAGGSNGVNLGALTGLVGTHSAVLGWLAALGLGLTVALAGWALGRRP